VLADRFGLQKEDWRPYVDTGPVMERGWSARAGMGWQGKNGMLISRQHGNWLFLASLLVRASIEPDPPLAGGRVQGIESGSLGQYCGTCVRCIEACPTEAITEPGLVDARRCLSYQNIENKGAIPRALRIAMGSRIFGCDICLQVCPWNRFARAGREMLLAARYDIAGLELFDLLTVTPERFAEVFRRTPFKRLKRERLLRNACVVAGNLDEVDGWKNRLGATREVIIGTLVDLAGSATPLVRAHAVWAVHRLEPQKAGQLLARARSSETDSSVLEEYAACAEGVST
jgi:epoxyqueuosine reductase